MRVVAIAAIITSLAVPALAQGDPSQGDPSKKEGNKAEERKKKESEEVERAYQDMLKRTTHGQPAKKTDRWDPWRNSR
jgi:ribosomal protein L12E/L44/L45/RPP1/RPP2